MKKKEIVVLDCGVEIRTEDQGILFNCIDPGREFAFGLKKEEIPDMILYLNTYTSGLAMPTTPITGGSVRELSPVEKARERGVEAMVLADPRSVPKKAPLPASAVHVHQP